MRWSFFTFNWSRFRDLETMLRKASDSADFSAFDSDEALSVLEEFDEGSAPEAIANALVADLCGMGDALVFEAGLPELIHFLRKQPHGEDINEILGLLISGDS